MAKRIRPMRDIIGEAIRGMPIQGEPQWTELAPERRESWMLDADRVMTALRNEMWWHFAEFAFEQGGVEWLANDPDDLWKDFFDDCIKNNGPTPIEIDPTAFR